MRNLHLLADDWRRARTLFAVRGRAKPWFPLSIYVAYSCVVVTYMRWYRTTPWLCSVACVCSKSAKPY